MRFIKYLFVSVIYLVSAAFVMIELAQFLYIKDGLIAGTISRGSLSFFSFVTLDYRVIYWQGNEIYRNFSIGMILIGYLFLWEIMFYSDKKNKNIHKEHMARKQKRNYSHLANWFEKRSGLQRIDYNAEGDLTSPMYSQLQSNIGTVLLGNGLFLFIMFLMKLILAVVNYCRSVSPRVFQIQQFGDLLFVPGEVLNGIYDISFSIVTITPLVFVVLSSFPVNHERQRKDKNTSYLVTLIIDKIVAFVEVIVYVMMSFKVYQITHAGWNDVGVTVRQIMYCIAILILIPFITKQLKRMIRGIEICHVNHESEKGEKDDESK